MKPAELRQVRTHLEYAVGNICELALHVGEDNQYVGQAEDEIRAVLDIIDRELLRS